MVKITLISESTETKTVDSGRTLLSAPSPTDALEKLKPIASDSVEEFCLSGLQAEENILFEILRILTPNGKVVIENSIASREAGQLLDSDLQISGFVNSMVAKDPSTGYRFAVASKPDWSIGAVAKANVVQVTSTKWKVNSLDLAEGDLVDEDDLLNDGLDTTKVKGGCGDAEVGTGGKRRACKNCTCGLADEEAGAQQEPQTTEQKIVKSSACGNCSRGDAFRCASCPFLGKPAFESGQERVMLTAMDDI